MNSLASAIGFRFFERDHRGRFELRLSWAEITGGFGWALGLCLFEEHYSLHIRLGWPNVFIRLPFLQRWHYDPHEMMESWGFTIVDRYSIHFNWGRRCKIVHMPWAWEWVRTSHLMEDGATWAHDLRGFRDKPLGTAGYEGRMAARYTELQKIPRWKRSYPYRYLLRSGQVQERTATIEVGEMEWRWRWFTALPWPRLVRRTIERPFPEWRAP